MVRTQTAIKASPRRTSIPSREVSRSTGAAYEEPNPYTRTGERPSVHLQAFTNSRLTCRSLQNGRVSCDPGGREGVHPYRRTGTRACRYGRSDRKRQAGSAAPRPRRGGAPIIELRDVTKVYPGGHMALDRVSLAINRGEFVFLVGPTGCGKSTLIKMLIRELDRDRGRGAGSPAATSAPCRRRRSRSCGATSAPSSRTSSCCPNRTVYDNVAYALQVIGASRAEIREQVPETLRLVGLSTKLHNYPDQLSGGEQQRVSIARAFVNHPPLLLADEPSGNLDPVTSIGIMQLLYRINKTGTTVVVVTHDREMVDNMRRRVIELYEGRVVRDEVSGGYTEESTTEFGMRMRAEMGVGPEGQTNGHDHELAVLMSRLFFFIQEAFRALRRNARAEHGGDRHHGRHRDPARRPDPDLPDDAGARARRSATSSSSGSAIYDDATRAEIAALRQRAAGDPARRSRSRYITKAEALQELKQRPRRTPRRSLERAATPTRCRPTSSSRPTTPPTSTRSAPTMTPPGRTASRQPISPIVQDVFDRQRGSARRSSR